MFRSAIEYLRHILDEIDYLESACSDLNQDAFLKDETLKRSFVRSVEIVGEASKQLPEDFKNKYDSIPWKRISGMRDRLIHAYFGVDYLIVWDVVKNKLPELKHQLKQILSIEAE